MDSTPGKPGKAVEYTGFDQKPDERQCIMQMEEKMKKSMYIALAAMALILMSSLPVLAHGHFRGNVWIGPVWGPGWWGPVYPYPYYAPPPVVVQQAPETYVQQAPETYVQQSPQSEEQSYWYYCGNPQGYYPYVKQCPNGWTRVVPSPAPPDREE